MINRFIELAQKIEKLSQGSELFPDICAREMAAFEFDVPLEDFEKELGKWIAAGKLPKQLNVYNSFGQPPVTLFNNEKFALDIYFWMYVDTSIHSHSFEGGFRLLYGRSIHEIFTVKPKEFFADDVMSTHIERRSTTLIKAGDTSSIVRGNEFSHRLIHLDAPTITLCVRTVNDEKKDQWHHFTNGLAIEKRSLSDVVIKSLYYYQYLFHQNRDFAISFLKDLVDSWDISVTLNLYEQISIDNMGIEEEAISCFFDMVVQKYGATEWFQIYENFYEQAQQYIEAEGNAPEDRFMEYAINSNYPFDEAKIFLEQIQGHELSQEQINLLSD